MLQDFTSLLKGVKDEVTAGVQRIINVFFVVFKMFMFISWRASQIERWQSMAFVLTGPCGPSLCRFTHTAELIFLCALYLDYPYLCL